MSKSSFRTSNIWIDEFEPKEFDQVIIWTKTYMGDQSMAFSHKNLYMVLIKEFVEYRFTQFNHYESGFALSRNGLHSKPKKFCG